MNEAIRSTRSASSGSSRRDCPRAHPDLRFGLGGDWYARDLKLRRGMMASLSGGLATMGPAMPYAIARQVRAPRAAGYRVVGDGAMQMVGINGLITIASTGRSGATRASSSWCSTTAT